MNHFDITGLPSNCWPYLWAFALAAAEELPPGDLEALGLQLASIPTEPRHLEAATYVRACIEGHEPEDFVHLLRGALEAGEMPAVTLAHRWLVVHIATAQALGRAMVH